MWFHVPDPADEVDGLSTFEIQIDDHAAKFLILALTSTELVPEEPLIPASPRSVTDWAKPDSGSTIKAQFGCCRRGLF